MPFTAAHPAIVILFRKLNPKFISLTGLIAGSIVPDFEYFLWMNPASHLSHTLQGIFLFNLPVVFLMAFAWHSLLAPQLLSTLPFLKNKLRKRYIQDFPSWLQKKWPVFLASAMIGILTHLVWDSFCHAGGYLVTRIEYLNTHEVILGHSIRRCYILWYISSIAGLLICMFYTMDRKQVNLKNIREIIRVKGRFWLEVFALTLVLAFIRISMGLSWNRTRHIIIILIGCFIYSVFIMAVIFNRLPRGRRG